jgi:mannose-6-phosphate isomerase-like protein (cupin superfamily)
MHTIGDGEEILRQGEREVSLLVACETVSVIRARYPAGDGVAGAHVHAHHTDAFYVLDGELTFTIGNEGRTVTASRGTLVAVPPGVSHSFRTSGIGPARWLTIHARDGGFASFMRGLRDGVEVRWDVSPVPVDGGAPAGTVIVSRGSAAASS